MNNPLIHGIDNTERIVSIEVNDSHAELFIEKTTGEIVSEFRDNKFWILTPNHYDRHSLRLDGNLHYRYATLFKTKEEFYEATGYLRNKDHYTIWNSKESFMIKEGVTYFKGMMANEPSILSFDIETTTLNPKDPVAKVLIIANTFRKQGKLVRKLFAYNEFNSQGEMLEAWCDWVREINPSIFLGYNICSFDLVYLQTAADRAGVKLNLGRNNSPLWFNKKESKFRKDGSQFYSYFKPNIYGREIVDGFFLALRYDIGRKYETYKLKQLIKQEGLEVEGRVFYDGEKIRHNYHIKEEFEKIKAYASFDGDDALALYDLMAPSVFYFTQSIPKPYQLMIESAAGSQLNAMIVRSYLQEKHSIPKADESIRFEGAISHGIPGVHKNVLSFDVASLYPSIMLEYKIYPEHKDPKNHTLQILEYFTKERLKNKKLAKDTGNKYYDDLQNSQKIGINSMYGFMGATGLNFNFPEGAAEVTRRGREVLMKAINWATGLDYEDWKKEKGIEEETEDSDE